eukprot:m.423486 g.423486  ORF g.423486 m.423486 type:complete len:57 (-) comp56659_c0_seq100:31-201(-)
MFVNLTLVGDDDLEDSKASKESYAKKKYERTRAAHGDTAFERFKERISRYPSQVLG